MALIKEYSYLLVVWTLDNEHDHGVVFSTSIRLNSNDTMAASIGFPSSLCTGHNIRSVSTVTAARITIKQADSRDSINR